jgi:hypothetical protein
LLIKNAIRQKGKNRKCGFSIILFIFDLWLTVLCMARCGKSARIFRRNRKIANCNEFRLGIQPQ